MLRASGEQINQLAMAVRSCAVFKEVLEENRQKLLKELPDIPIDKVQVAQGRCKALGEVIDLLDQVLKPRGTV